MERPPCAIVQLSLFKEDSTITGSKSDPFFSSNGEVNLPPKYLLFLFLKIGGVSINSPNDILYSLWVVLVGGGVGWELFP